MSVEIIMCVCIQFGVCLNPPGTMDLSVVSIQFVLLLLFLLSQLEIQKAL